MLYVACLFGTSLGAVNTLQIIQVTWSSITWTSFAGFFTLPLISEQVFIQYSLSALYVICVVGIDVLCFRRFFIPKGGVPQIVKKQ
jgi:hypothetical protein